jgi:WD40 repeat protein
MLRAAETLVLCSPQGIYTASIGEHGRISYRGTNDDAVEHTFYICNAQALAFSDDGKLLAAAGGRNGSQGKIKVWRLSDHKQLCEIVISGEGARTLGLATDGNIVVAAQSDGSVTAWRVSDGKLQWSRNILPAVQALQFAPDGKGLLVQCADGTERRLDTAKGRNPFQPKVAKE